MTANPQQHPTLNLKSVTLQKNQVASWEAYPFCLPTIQTLSQLTFTRQICFFAGEKRTGKSTLLEAIAHNAGLAADNASDTNPAIGVLSNALHLTWNQQPPASYYLSAENAYALERFLPTIQDQNTASSAKPLSEGQAFLRFAKQRFSQPGLYLLDEPEDDLTIIEQIRLLVVLHYLTRQSHEVQFIIVTHSTEMMVYPHGQIFMFGGGPIEEIRYGRYAQQMGYDNLGEVVIWLLFASGLWRFLLPK
jgi:predicted ATPase